MARVASAGCVAMLMLSACVVGASDALPGGTTSGDPIGEPPASEGCGPVANDYTACTTADAKPGWCVPDTGCIETCSDVQTVCWTFSYAWPHDPEMEHDPICWCSDDNWLAPSQR